MTTTYDDPRRWWALAALGLAVLTLGFDITIMNVALPTIATELEVGTDGLQWMVNAYVLVIAGLLVLDERVDGLVCPHAGVGPNHAPSRAVGTPSC